MFFIDGRPVSLGEWLRELRAIAQDEDSAQPQKVDALAPTAPGAFLYAGCGVPGDGE